ncbi:MAG: DUF308 domain-containing protein [Christensenella sp.]|nr:DUF308 domain-containing protein [Christensenella sp.]
MSDTWKSKDMIRLILSIVLLVIGIILLAAPQAAMIGIVILIGVVMLVYSGVTIIMTISKRNKGEHALFTIPIIVLIIGILLLVFRDGVANVLLPIIIGIWAIVTGIMSIIDASSLKHMGSSSWKVPTITGVAALALGIIMLIGIAATNVVGILLGVCLLIYGIITIVEWIVVATARKNIS